MKGGPTMTLKSLIYLYIILNNHIAVFFSFSPVICYAAGSSGKSSQVRTLLDSDLNFVELAFEFCADVLMFYFLL